MNKSDVWKRDKQQIMAQIQADAEANNEPLSEDVLEMMELVLDMENKAYEAGYKKALQMPEKKCLNTPKQEGWRWNEKKQRNSN